jgi:Meiotically up-regulated gene 113
LIICKGWCDSPASESSPRGFCDNCDEWWTRVSNTPLSDISDNSYSSPKIKYGTYFIKCNDFIKIGKASNIDVRMRELQIGNPYKLELLAFIKDKSLEKKLHIKFNHLSYSGEWFRITPELEAYIAAI